MTYLCCRHLYIPIVEMGYSKTTASVTVFFISAFFHEYLVSVPLKTFKIWAFMGMMGQVRFPRVYFDYVLLTVQILTLASRNSCLSFKNCMALDSFNNVLTSRSLLILGNGSEFTRILNTPDKKINLKNVLC